MFEAFQIGPMLIRTHVLLLLLGVVFGANLFVRLAAADGLRIGMFLKKGWWFVLGFLLGGRLFGILLLYRVYVKDPLRILVVWDGMFSVAGACIGVAVVLIVLLWNQRAQFLKWIDTYMPAVTLLLACDWLGRFFGALSYGKPTDSMLGVTYESIGVRFAVPIHPVQLYYALWFIVLTWVLLILRKRTSVSLARYSISIAQTGMVTVVGVSFSCLAVILFEVFRGDFAMMVFAKLTDVLFLGALFVSLGIIAVLERRISPKASLINSMCVGGATIAYLLIRPMISVAAVEWRLSQFLAILAVLATIVYVVAHRWKYPHL